MHSLEKRAIWSRRGWVQLTLLLVTVGIALPLIIRSMRTLPLFQQLLVMMPIGLTAGLLIRYVALALTRRDAARFLRAALLDCGVPVCLDCGYCLRGLSSECCPECGRKIDERVTKLIRRGA